MKIRLILFSAILSITTLAQEKKNMILISPNYSYQFPIADMKDIYGNNSLIGIDISKINNQNILYGFSGHFIFSDNIKDTTILDHLMDANRNIIDENGQIANVLLQQRGFSFYTKLGYFYPLKHNSSGLLSYMGLGFLQHKIRIDIRNSNTPQLSKENLEMYDQLSNGIITSGFLGYMHISKKNHAHIYIGIECIRGFTKNRRNYNYNAGGAIKELRNDSFFGIKFGWIIPVGKRNTKEYYYN